MRVLIIGAGMSGLCLAIALQRARIPFQILEKAPRLGGTWWENTYPGCACDIPSHLYGFSFAPEPGWSRVYPGQPEILGYLERLARRHRLEERIRCDVRVREARWSEADQRWAVTTAAGERYEAEVLVSAVGALHVPNYPGLPGVGEFQGPRWHSATWDHSVDLEGKRVGVIGNGASAVQFVPQIAPRAARTYVFQRTAHWVLPKDDGPYPAWLRRFFRTFPGLLRLYRALIYLRHEAGFLLAFDRAALGERWLRYVARRHLEAAISDPRLREVLVPDYQPGCKRILLSNDYYPTLARDDVELVTERLVAETPAGVETAAGELELDALIYATGFQPLAWGHVEVYGRGGERLGERWGDAPRAHLGMSVPGFPNYYLLLGPNTGLGHNSVMWMVECQVNYVLQLLREQRRAGHAALEVRPAALEEGYAWLRERLGGKVWTDCRSWYQNDEGLIYALWPATTARYCWELRRPRLADFVAR